MERNARYFAVGLFVVLTLLAGFWFAGLFYQRQPHQQTALYELHFTSSVEGLAQGSEVRYLGVKVGEVSEVFLLPAARGVGVRIRIAAHTPVDGATVATLRQQGLTGVPFVHLFQDGQRPAAALPQTADGIPLLATQPSDFESLLAALPELQRNLNQVLLALADAFNPENRQHLSQILRNVDETTAGLPALVQELRHTSQQVGVLAKETTMAVKGAGQGMQDSMQSLQATLARAEQTLAAITQAAQQLQQVGAGVGHVVLENRGQLALTLQETQQALQAIRALATGLQENPRQLWLPSSPQGTELPP